MLTLQTTGAVESAGLSTHWGLCRGSTRIYSCGWAEIFIRPSGLERFTNGGRKSDQGIQGPRRPPDQLIITVVLFQLIPAGLLRTILAGNARVF